MTVTKSTQWILQDSFAIAHRALIIKDTGRRRAPLQKLRGRPRRKQGMAIRTVCRSYDAANRKSYIRSIADATNDFRPSPRTKEVGRGENRRKLSAGKCAQRCARGMLAFALRAFARARLQMSRVSPDSAPKRLYRQMDLKRRRGFR